MGIVQGPEGLLADVNAIQRRLGEVDLAVRDQLRQVALMARERRSGSRRRSSASGRVGALYGVDRRRTGFQFRMTVSGRVA